MTWRQTVTTGSSRAPQACSVMTSPSRRRHSSTGWNADSMNVRVDCGGKTHTTAPSAAQPYSYPTSSPRTGSHCWTLPHARQDNMAKSVLILCEHSQVSNGSVP